MGCPKCCKDACEVDLLDFLGNATYADMSREFRQTGCHVADSSSTVIVQQGRQADALSSHPAAAPSQSIAELKGKLGALAVHQPVLSNGPGKFYGSFARMRSCSEETDSDGLEHAHSKVAAALKKMSAAGKLFAGELLCTRVCIPPLVTMLPIDAVKEFTSLPEATENGSSCCIVWQ